MPKTPEFPKSGIASPQKVWMHHRLVRLSQYRTPYLHAIPSPLSSVISVLLTFDFFAWCEEL